MNKEEWLEPSDHDIYKDGLWIPENHVKVTQDFKIKLNEFIENYKKRQKEIWGSDDGVFKRNENRKRRNDKTRGSGSNNR